MTTSATTATTITKRHLIDRIADQTRQKRTVVKKTIQCFLDNVIVELQSGHRLEFRDFGVFEIRERAARVAQNPKTLQRVPVPPKKTVKFKVGRLMKDALEGRHNGTIAAASYQVTAADHQAD
jgi:integration host factor subunit beta